MEKLYTPCSVRCTDVIDHRGFYGVNQIVTDVA
jgi:hypothetical protein